MATVMQQIKIKTQRSAKVRN